MDNLLAGLEKFGLDASGSLDLYGDDDKKKNTGTDANGKKEEVIPTESEFLLQKGVRCKLCDKGFKTIMIKSGRVKRLEPDPDLRPRYQYIDTLKYGVTSCPYCGYTAMSSHFDAPLTSVQIKLLKEKICANFKPASDELPETYTYDEALERYKLALFNCVVKKAKASEIAFTCLKISWLLRGKAEELQQAKNVDKEALAKVKQEENAFYAQAYEGFTKASATEMFPMCGMGQTTVDFLLAYMAYKFGRLDVASKLIGSIVTNPAADRRTKERALDLKEEILAKLKENKSK